MTNILYRIVIITILSVLFKQYAAPYLVSDERAIVQQYLYNESYSNVKPYMWIHVPNDLNSRSWESFNERNSTNLNMPIVEECLRSILEHNSKIYNILLITDDDFAELLEDWKYDISNSSELEKNMFRRLGKLLLLSKYGGVSVPMSLYCLKSWNVLMNLKDKTGFSIICDDQNIIIGSKKNDKNLNAHIENVKLYVSDNSSETKFKDLMNKSLQQNIKIINGKQFGICDANDEVIDISKLLSSNKINFVENLQGIYIPVEKILKSNKYGWFVRESVERIKSSNIDISKKFI